MSVITFPGTTQGPFGGPADSGQNLMQMVLAMMQGQQKQKADQEQDVLSQILGRQNKTGIDPAEAQRFGVTPQPASLDDKVEMILADTRLGPEVRQQGLEQLALTKKIRGTDKPAKNVKIDAFKNGQKRPFMVAEANFNDTVEKLAKAGYEFQGAEKDNFHITRANVDGTPRFIGIDKTTLEPTLLDEKFQPEQKGQKIEFNPENGQFSYVSGTGDFLNQGNVPLARTPMNKAQEKVMAQTDAISRLENIKSQLESSEGPGADLLTAPNKLSSMMLNFRDKLKGFSGISELNENDKKFLIKSSNLYQDAAENINLGIKEITGAQMSNAEAKRLRPQMPDPGDPDSFFFWLQGDGPTKFKAKVENNLVAHKLSRARYMMYQRQGLSDSEIESKILNGEAPEVINADGTPADDMREIIKTELNSQAKALQVKGVDGAALKSQIASLRKELFGY